MRNSILAFGLCGTFLSMSVFTSAAVAQNVPVFAGFHDRYMSIGGSLAMSSDVRGELNGISDIETLDNTNIGGYAGVGASINHSDSGVASMRVEAEGRWVNLDAESLLGNGTSGDIDQKSLMANGYLDFNLGQQLDAYVGAGVGGVKLDGTVRNGTAGVGFDDWTVGYQGMAGVMFPVTPLAHARLGYRYTETGDVAATFSDTGMSDKGEFSITGQHNIDVGVLFNF